MLFPQLLAIGPVIVYLHTLKFPLGSWYAVPFVFATYAYVKNSALLPTWLNVIGFVFEIVYILHLNTARHFNRTTTIVVGAVATVTKLVFLSLALVYRVDATMITAWITTLITWLLVVIYGAPNDSEQNFIKPYDKQSEKKGSTEDSPKAAFVF